jgi:hypothetical protein
MSAVRKLTAMQRAARRWQRPPVHLRLVQITPVPPTLADRIADAAWRLHDGMPFAWSVLFGFLLAMSAAFAAAAIAALAGWQP